MEPLFGDPCGGVRQPKDRSLRMLVLIHELSQSCVGIGGLEAAAGSEIYYVMY